MKEIKSILAHWKQLPPGTQSALATVVGIAGSSYRRIGARMLMTSDGRWTGGISGGCLEGDALRKAQQVVFSGQPRLVTYNTLEDDPFQVGASLGCQGLIEVMIQRVNPGDPQNPLALLERAVAANRPAAMLSVVGGNAIPLGTKALVFPEGEILGEWPEGLDRELALDLGKPVLDDKGSLRKTITLPGGQEVVLLAELLLPPVHLILFGNNYDVYPLLEIGRVLGWQMTVVAKASKLQKTALELAALSDDLPPLSNAGRTAAVLMAHDFETDKANLQKLLATNIPYIGLLGPLKRKERLLSELTPAPAGEDLPRIYGPAGLITGGHTPEEIALSVAAQIQVIMQ